MSQRIREADLSCQGPGSYGFSVFLQKSSAMSSLGVDVKPLRDGALLAGIVKDVGLASEWDLKHAEGKDIFRFRDVITAVSGVHASTCDLRHVLHSTETLDWEIYR